MKLQTIILGSVALFLLADHAYCDVIDESSLSIHQVSSFYNDFPIAQFPGHGPENLINTQGFDGTTHDNWSDGNFNSYGGFWTTNTGDVAGSYVTIDLGQTYNVSQIQIWNYNVSGFTDRSAKEVEVLASTDGSTFSLQNTLSLSEAPGANGYTGESFGYSTPFTARYVKLLIDSDYGDSSFTGLSQVQFSTPSAETTPLPPVLLGGVSLFAAHSVIARRRRRSFQ